MRADVKDAWLRYGPQRRSEKGILMIDQYLSQSLLVSGSEMDGQTMVTHPVQRFPRNTDAHQ